MYEVLDGMWEVDFMQEGVGKDLRECGVWGGGFIIFINMGGV